MEHQACSDYPSAVVLREGEESPESRKARETFRSSASGRDLQEKSGLRHMKGCMSSSEQADGGSQRSPG